MRKSLVLILVCAILFSSVGISGSSYAIAAQNSGINAHFGEPEEGELDEFVEETPATIIGEDETQRDRASKEFILSDLSRMLVLYPNAVHYDDGGEWREIDNTLVRSTKDSGAAILINKESDFKVALPEVLDRQGSIDIEKDGYRLEIMWMGIHVSLEQLASAQESGIDLPIRAKGAAQTTKQIEQSENVDTEITAESDALPTAEGIDMDPTSESVAEGTQGSFARTETLQSAKAEILSLEDGGTIAPQAIDEEIAPENLDSALIYKDVFSSTDVRYDIAPDSLKESIIVKELPLEPQAYRFKITAPGMSLAQTNDGIYVYAEADEEQTNPIYFLPAPFMADHLGEHSDDVAVELIPSQEVNGEYVLVYTPSYEWMREDGRAWPVIIDPVVQADLSANNIRDTYIASSYTTSNLRAYFEAGWHKSKGIERMFLMYDNLPTLSSADIITEATIRIYREYDSDVVSQVNVHKVDATWVAADLQWANRPSYNPIIEDYRMVQNIGWYTWNVTEIVQDWYAGDNTGMMFKLPDAIENAQGATNNKTFASSDCGQYFRPVLAITYRNNNGLEDYWDYHSQSVGRAGTGHINDYTGNLVFTHGDLGVSGNIMPVSITHVYNANDKANNGFGLGYGWRTNYNQLVYQWAANTNYYIWEDADATKHYFKYASASTYKDEDGLELVLTTNGGSSMPYTITAKSGDKLKFDSQGRLVRIENYKATVKTILLTYTSTTSKLISTIKDGTNRTYSFTYANNLLSSMDYKGTGSTSLDNLGFAYSSGGDLSSVTYKDGKSVSYGYDANHLLLSAQDIDGIRVTYDYNTNDNAKPNRVVQTALYDGAALGGELGIAYAHNQTSFSDYQGRKVIEQFNNSGNTVSAQDDNGFAEYAKYADANADGTSKPNQLLTKSKLQNTVKNLLLNHGAEYDEGWQEHGGSSTFNYTTAEKHIGNQSIQVGGGSTGAPIGARQTFALEAGKSYAFSGFVKVDAVTGDGARLSILHDGQAVSSRGVAGTQGWQRVEVSYIMPVNATNTDVSFALELAGGGTAYFDALQAEPTTTASRYNLLENSDFSYQGAGSETALHWTESDDSSATEKRLVSTEIEPATPDLDDAYYTMLGDGVLNKRVYQDLTVYGQVGDTFALTGWARGDSVPKTSADRSFGLVVRFYNTDNTTTERFLHFNEDANSMIGWQYAAERIVADKPYSMVRVLCVYEHNTNPVYFDGIQLFKEEFGASYAYDADGNVTSVSDLQKQQTSYQYQSNNLTSATLPSGANYTYTYNAYHDPLSAKSAMNVQTAVTYASNGNMTSVKVGSATAKIESNATYSSSGNYLASITDSARKKTTMSYDEQKGTLTWLQLPNDTSAARTTFAYDSMNP
jgi:YD repeat-containing protein